MKIRELAFEILCAVIEDGAYSNIVLNKALNNNDLSKEDKGFLTMIIHGTLQHYFLLEYELNQVIDHPIKVKMKIILLMGLYQMRFMSKVPAYAIINEAVEMAKALDGHGGGSFANGVLRTLSRQLKELDVEKITDYNDYLSIKFATPKFIIKMWRNQYNDEITKKILKANQKIPPLSLRVDLNKISREKILRNNNFIIGNVSKFAVIYEGDEKIADLEEFKQGFIVAQDEAGQLVAPLLDLSAHDRILDMCAAPGSKTLHMASLLKNQGKIIAVDLYPHRINLLTVTLKKLNYQNVEAYAFDSLKLLEKYPKASFNKILLDVPCSGLGVTRRKQDILLKITPSDLDSILEVQEKLLETAYQLLENNGILVYSTCTLNKKENEYMIEKFVRNHPDMELVLSKTLFPFEYDTDGFYMAKVIKK